MKCNPNVVGVVIIVAVAAIFAALFTLSIIISRPELDPITNCPVDERYGYGVTSIVIDRTDPFSDSQEEYIDSKVEKLLLGLDDLERVRVFAVTEESFSPQPVFDRCNPGSPENASALYEDPRQIRKSFEKDFRVPFAATFTATLVQEPLRSSPIMETIGAAGYYQELDEQATGHRIYIISDLLQNVPGYSQYTDTLSYGEFQELEYSAAVASNLMGAEVEILYMRRRGLDNDFVRRHLDFWYSYLQHQGATVVGVTKVR